VTRWVLVASFGRASVAGEVDDWLRAARAVRELPGVLSSDVDLDLTDSFGGGDATWDLEVDVPLEELPAVQALTTPGSAALRACERVALQPVLTGSDPFDGPRLKRTLLLGVDPSTPDAVVEQFELSMAAMAEHVSAIRSWALSRVDPTRSTGPWTHAWEQEFADLDGLRRGYLRAPYHLTAVERWFDHEIPGAIVDESTVAHLVRPAEAAVLPPAVGTTTTHHDRS
jgi:hypothetical protein